MSLFTKKQPPAPDLRLEALEAEYKNYRRRTQDARETAYQDAQRKTVLAFLPLYDDLERALSAPCQDAAYRKGIELMMQNLLSILAGLKVQPMRIVQVVQTGFTMDEEVLRHAKVVVAN